MSTAGGPQGEVLQIWALGAIPDYGYGFLLHNLFLYFIEWSIAYIYISEVYHRITEARIICTEEAPGEFSLSLAPLKISTMYRIRSTGLC